MRVEHGIMKAFCGEKYINLFRLLTADGNLLVSIGHDGQSPASSFLHELLRSFMQSLRIRIVDLDAVVGINQRETFGFARVILHRKNYPKAILDRNVNQLMNKAIDAVYCYFY